jgi:hypothetical protein
MAAPWAPAPIVFYYDLVNGAYLSQIYPQKWQLYIYLKERTSCIFYNTYC